MNTMHTARYQRTLQFTESDDFIEDINTIDDLCQVYGSYAETPMDYSIYHQGDPEFWDRVVSLDSLGAGDAPNNYGLNRNYDGQTTPYTNEMCFTRNPYKLENIESTDCASYTRNTNSNDESVGGRTTVNNNLFYEQAVCYDDEQMRHKNTQCKREKGTPRLCCARNDLIYAPFTTNYNENNSLSTRPIPSEEIQPTAIPSLILPTEDNVLFCRRTYIPETCVNRPRSQFEDYHKIKQRTSANVRERKRMNSINNAFDVLRGVVPQVTSSERRLSKIDTLRIAMRYIGHLKGLVDLTSEGEESQPIKVIMASRPTVYTDDGTGIYTTLLGHSLSWKHEQPSYRIAENRFTAKIWMPPGPLDDTHSK